MVPRWGSPDAARDSLVPVGTTAPSFSDSLISPSARPSSLRIWPTISSQASLSRALVIRICSWQSFTVAGLEPRMLRMASTKSANLICPSVAKCSKITSIISASTTISPPQLCTARSTPGSSMRFWKSDWEKKLSSLYPAFRNSLRICEATCSTLIASFSVAAITDTTSTSTPTSMYISVIDTKVTKKMISGHNHGSIFVTSLTSAALSGNTPLSSNLFMASGTVSENWFSLPSVSCRKSTAKM
mmetsp:Transcript_98818/g.235568  ORF Transcript_98818/g.235568 Transcript_98818/m.235568 type:complete len:244 (+) Transcript_98818:66-797(+)